MPHDISLIATITMGLVLAYFGGLVAHRLRLPPLVGYLLAGVALGRSSVTLGLLPPEGRDLILAGAILSITLNRSCLPRSIRWPPGPGPGRG